MCSAHHSSPRDIDTPHTFPVAGESNARALLLLLPPLLLPPMLLLLLPLPLPLLVPPLLLLVPPPLLSHNCLKHWYARQVPT
jgi:hypothetical protein